MILPLHWGAGDQHERWPSWAIYSPASTSSAISAAACPSVEGQMASRCRAYRDAEVVETLEDDGRDGGRSHRRVAPFVAPAPDKGQQVGLSRLFSPPPATASQA